MPISINHPTNSQSLAFILHTLSEWKKAHSTLQATYQYTPTTNTHFLLLQPTTVFKQKKFVKKIAVAILKFYELFPTEAIVIMEKNKANIIENGSDILTKEGFQISTEMMELISESLLPKSVEKLVKLPSH